MCAVSYMYVYTYSTLDDIEYNENLPFPDPKVWQTTKDIRSVPGIIFVYMETHTYTYTIIAVLYTHTLKRSRDQTETQTYRNDINKLLVCYGFNKLNTSEIIQNKLMFISLVFDWIYVFANRQSIKKSHSFSPTRC